MSGDEYYLGEYEDDWEPYTAADELAERTIHSPVILSYNAVLDLYEWDDEEPESEDDYDDFTPLNELKADRSTKKTKTSEQANGRRTHSAERTKALLARRPVFWQPRSERDRSPDLPFKGTQTLPAVALLKDWRQHLNEESTSQASRGETRESLPTRNDGFEEEEYCADEDTEMSRPELPPSTIDGNSNDRSAIPKQPAFMNGTASFLAKQAMLQASSNVADESKSRKRKATEQADESVPLKRGPKAKLPKDNEPAESRVVEVKIDQKPMIESEKDAADKPGQRRGRPKRAEKARAETATLASTRSTRKKKK